MNAPPKKDIAAQFAELGAQHDAIANSVDPSKGPEPGQLLMLMFTRIQMLDLKLDMLAIGLGKATDPNKPRLVVPGRQ